MDPPSYLLRRAPLRRLLPFLCVEVKLAASDLPELGQGSLKPPLVRVEAAKQPWVTRVKLSDLTLAQGAVRGYIDTW